MDSRRVRSPRHPTAQPPEQSFTVPPTIHDRIASELGVSVQQVLAAIALLDEGATVPFIARYRKERTGGLDDVQLRALEERLTYLRELEERRSKVLAAIEEQGKMTPGLRAAIEAAETKTRLEDLYRPYMVKRRTKAQIARAQAALEYADTQAKRSEDLAAKGVMSRGELEKYLLSQRTAKAELDSARFGARVADHELQMARAALGLLDGGKSDETQMVVPSPITGRVLEVLQQSEGVVQTGVPLVELETVNHLLWLTDSAGMAAILEPGLFGRTVWFHVRSHGYELPADGFGYRGVRVEVTAGGSRTVCTDHDDPETREQVAATQRHSPDDSQERLGNQ